LDVGQDVATLTAALVDVYSESGHETELADAVESALRPLGHLNVDRDGDAVIARTSWGHGERVVLAGHLDTVPPAGNLPSIRDGDTLRGLGTADMKGGVAVMLRLAATVLSSGRDVTYVFYDGEEVESERNGLLRLTRQHPDWLSGDFAVLLEPTDGVVEGGCQGTMRVEVRVPGVRAHSARAWMGTNAVHETGHVLDRLRAYEPGRPVVDGLEYREGLNAVRIRGGVAGNVIPDECVVEVNFRFAPDRSVDEAAEHVGEVFEGYQVTVTDAAPGARPGLQHPAAQAFTMAVGGVPRAKYGWTDVAQFAQLGVPAVNYGPGDPNVAHSAGESVSIRQLFDVEANLERWLTS
jgi:succinyl-diaminopimelate desuccinylase